MIYLILVFILGLLFGSFANVCIWRIPRGISIVQPRSFCTGCMKTISFVYNIPLISYVFLKGRCAYCGTKISIRYPIVELLTATIITLLFFKFGLSPASFIFSVFAVFLIIIAAIDIEHQIIAPELNYPLMAFGLATSFFNVFTNGIFHSLLGLTVGGGVVMLIRIGGKFLFKKEAMGLGDVKLMMAIGAFTGVGGIFWVLFTASISGSMVGITMRVLKKKDKFEYIPFGPYLAIGAVIYINFSGYLNNLLF